MNVLSLFDGISCGQIALERAGIKVYATMTDNHLPNKKFIVDSIITDYRLGKQEIRLIEKK